MTFQLLASCLLGLRFFWARVNVPYAASVRFLSLMRPR